MADLSFVEVLSAMQGSIGEPVDILVCSGQGRPRGATAMLTGALSAGPGARDVFGDQAPADAVVFVVGVDGHGVTGYVVLDPDSFERAFWTDAGALTIAQGGIVFVVRMPEVAGPGEG
ncbi:hypothetical protein [Capillimicrobium parvum]|uniref:Uncharacterized protein n=1 Tax=Capillimicrobium parvum TaxID=2884022 RepID=A0A9E6Y0C2_9ACTN|nr:hypothetical protein [Capillimicrobium parvum]UGS37616.1 hypothetical protein DSM104329_04034 [Capillimicrobium parvum]